MTHDPRAYATASEPWFRERLKTLVEHRTVSPGKTGDEAIVAGARAACEIMADAGADARLVECDGTPSVLGAFRHPQARATVVVYNHLDVQPADAANWTQDDPFAFQVEDHPTRERLYRGRGATDDKGPALCALRAAQYVREHDVPIDVVLLWETEEEIGSPNFGQVVERARDDLRCDGVIVSDTIWPSDRQPVISTALRGTLQVILRLQTGHKDVHSGLTGGVARNPVRELARLATAIDDASFWKEDVEPPSQAEIEGYVRSGFDPAYFKRAHALDKLTTEIPLEMLIRLWARPTWEIHGIAGGYQGPGVKTAVPPWAELKASFRLVPNQDPHEIGRRLQAFVAQVNPDVEVDLEGYLGPYRGPTEGPVHDAIAAGMTQAFGTAPVMVREGGSIGAAPILADVLGVGVHFLPLSLPEHGYHAPNEYFDWKQARGGIEAFARAFMALAGG